MSGAPPSRSHKVGDYRGPQRKFEVERERLRKLARTSNPITQPHLREAGIARGWRCLEVGAGEGSMCAWMREQVGEGGRVVAADIDTRFLVDADRPGIEILELDLRESGLEKDAFDLAYTRNMLLHLPDPDEALRKLAAALAPAGILFAQEGDMCLQQAADPDHPNAELVEHFFATAYKHIRATKLFDTRFGRTLPARFRALGMEDIEVRPMVELHASGSELEHLLVQTMEVSLGPVLVAAGVFTQQEIDAALAGLCDPGFELISGVQFAVWGRKHA